MTESAAGAPYPIRPIGPDEFDRFQLVEQHGFNEGPITEDDRRLALTRFEPGGVRRRHADRHRGRLQFPAERAGL
jgi:hypothetical protein